MNKGIMFVYCRINLRSRRSRMLRYRTFSCRNSPLPSTKSTHEEEGDRHPHYSEFVAVEVVHELPVDEVALEPSVHEVEVEVLVMR